MSEKVNVDLQDLKELAVLARKNGTTDAFITLALQWAEMANDEIAKLRTGWQPIETAPRGIGMDNEFLGWDGSSVDKTWEGWDIEGKPVYVHADWISWNPTHWMPLPEGPKQ